jgi:16S rRNA (cytosine1402-N4)-methyltransferase
MSRRIARAIVVARGSEGVNTTGDLARVVDKCVKGRFAIKSLARVFQGIRIEVNDELNQLAEVLAGSLRFLTEGARIVVIAYHSLEDRIVKQFFHDHAATSIPSGNKYIPDTPRRAEVTIITKKPLMATEQEMQRNPRSRSAKMRVAERTAVR